MGQGDVQRVAEARTGAGFILGTCSRIKRVAMDRQEGDSLRLVEDLLGAVAVVNVKIDDQDASKLEPGQGFGRGQ